MKYKIGDRVKTEYGTGTVVVEIQGRVAPYFVRHDTWNEGHNNNKYTECKYYWFYEDELQPLNQITPEAGKIYRVKDGKKCLAFSGDKGEYIQINKIDEDGFLFYNILNKEKERVLSCCYCFKPEDLIEVEEEKGEESVIPCYENGHIIYLSNNALNYYSTDPGLTPEPKKGNFMTNIVKRIKDLALSETDRLLRQDGFEDKQGKMTEQARQMMREEMEEERWKANREEVAKKLKQLGEK